MNIPYLTLDVLVIRVDIWYVADEMQLDQTADIIFLVDAGGRNVVIALLYSHCR